MIRRRIGSNVTDALSRFPVVALIGPRQVGKTTLALNVVADIGRPIVHLDLERPSHVARLAEPELYLQQHQEALVVLDEVQRVPEQFPVVRALVDARRTPGRFLILGFASPELLRQSSESPTVTRGFWNGLQDLEIERAIVIHPGDEGWPLGPNVRAEPARRLADVDAWTV